jgi:hypothetical protein
MSTVAGPPESESRKVSHSREESNIQQDTSATAEGTHNSNISNSSRDDRNITDLNGRRRPATAEFPEIIEMPETVLAPAESPTA